MEWFEQIEPSTFSESELESRIILHAPTIYPEYYVLPFKQTVESPHGKAKADLIFIAKDYSDWWICETEMGYHDLIAHVEPQIQILTAAYYGEKEVQYVCSKLPELNYQKILKLIQNTPVKVLVIVNEPKKEWIRPLSKYGAIVAVFELFRSNGNDEIFRVNGEYPSRYISHISKCIFHPIIPRYLEVTNPDLLNLPKHGRIVLKYNNCITEWERIDAENKVWLSPVGRNPLSTNCEYEIYQQGDSTLVLRQYEK